MIPGFIQMFPLVSPSSDVAIPGRNPSMVIVIGRHKTLGPRQKGRYSPNDTCKCIFLNENIWISIKISLKFVPKDPANSIPALVQIMAWCRSGAYMRHSVSYSKRRNSARWRNRLRDIICKSTRGSYVDDLMLHPPPPPPPPPPPSFPNKRMHILCNRRFGWSLVTEYTLPLITLRLLHHSQWFLITIPVPW